MTTEVYLLQTLQEIKEMQAGGWGVLKDNTYCAL